LTMALTPSEELYLYACFIRALNEVASTRSNSTEGSGTTRKNASSRLPCTIGPATQPTLSDTLHCRGDARLGVK